MVDVEIERTFDADYINRISNHPSIFPYVKGIFDEPPDLSEVVSDKRNIMLFGKCGGALFCYFDDEHYECHVRVLPEGRGKWALKMLKTSIRWMFENTSAVEIRCRVPKGNIASHAIARAAGGKFEFIMPNGWVQDGELVPTTIYSLSKERWSRLNA